MGIVFNIIGGIIGGILACVVLIIGANYQIKRDEKKKAEDSDVEDSDDSDIEEPSTVEAATATTDGIVWAKDIVLSTLNDLQCQPNVKDTDDVSNIQFEYQGENFTIHCDGIGATVYDLAWHSFEASDLQMLSNVKRIINEINQRQPVVLSYVLNEESKQYYVHAITRMVASKDIDFKDYLQTTLRNCFTAHFYFYHELATCPQQEG